MDDSSKLLEPSLDKQLKGHLQAITAIHYNPNEQQVASGSLDNSILLWDLCGKLRSYRFKGHEEAVTDVSFSPSGKYMASASRDRTVRLWVPTVTGSTGVFRAHSQTVRSVQFSPDGSKIITASDDKIVKLWSSIKYKFISSFVGHTNWVRCARMSSDGSIIASCSDDKTTRLWNPDSGELIHTYKDKNGHSMHVAWHPSGCYIAVGTSHGDIKLYDIRTHGLVQYYSIHNDAIMQLAFHPSGSYILTASKDGNMKILDLLEGHPLFTLSAHTGSVNAVNFSPGGETFASAGDDKIINLWRTNFTELANDMKENLEKIASVPGSASHTSKLTRVTGKQPQPTTQGTRHWYLCYHSNKYPVANFVHVDDHQEPCCNLWKQPCRTLRSIIENNQTVENNPVNESLCHTDRTMATINETSLFASSDHRVLTNSTSRDFRHESTPHCELECGSPGVDRISHIPRSCSNEKYRVMRCMSPPEPDHNLECSFQNSTRFDAAQSCGRSLCSNENCSSRRVIAPASHSNPVSTSQGFGHTRCKFPAFDKNVNTNTTLGSIRRESVNKCSPECPSRSVDDVSHIPRACAPKPSSYTIPCLEHKCVGLDSFQQDASDSLFGMIKLKETDVCYTNGTIEWVGRKRSYPINSGFKTMDDFSCYESNIKKVKRGVPSLGNCNVDNVKDCECADMLPTVNAIVDHLNALHEAVDLIDLRLNTVEDNVF